MKAARNIILALIMTMLAMGAIKGFVWNHMPDKFGGFAAIALWFIFYIKLENIVHSPRRLRK